VPRPAGVRCRPLLRRGEPEFVFAPLCRFDLGGFFLHQLDEVVDDVGVLQAVIGQAADINLVGAVAAAGEADVGFARLARPLTTQPITYTVIAP
jgi:hypothetical protein